MSTFQDFNLSKMIANAVSDLGFTTPTPIQEAAYPVILSGRDVVGIAQTGTGKSLAYLLPILQELKFSEQVSPRVLIIAPTRELVIQLAENIKEICRYKKLRALGVYGGTNINTQALEVAKGCDVLVATPGRLFDLTVSRALKLKTIQKLVLDEVDVLLDLGFRVQLTNIFDLLPERRQNIMFSATMTDEVDALIQDFFLNPIKVQIAASGEPLKNIEQSSYFVPNYHTKINLLSHLLNNKEEFHKVLVFVTSKKVANDLFEKMHEEQSAVGVIHGNKDQNYRNEMIQKFDGGNVRILIATDVIARGIDLDQLSHVINFDTPSFPENYIHRIGRTGRAQKSGKSILFFTEKEEHDKKDIEKLMNYEIPEMYWPEEVKVSRKLTIEEQDKIPVKRNRKTKPKGHGLGIHEKSAKNNKDFNVGSGMKRKLKNKHKGPRTKGDKGANLRRKSK